MHLHHHLDVWLKIACLAWGALESLRYWRVTQRRVALGLADPLVSASFLAWGISLGAGALGFALIWAALLALAPGEHLSDGIQLALSLCGIVAAAGLYLAFLPPQGLRAPARRARERTDGRRLMADSAVFEFVAGELERVHGPRPARGARRRAQRAREGALRPECGERRPDAAADRAAASGGNPRNGVADAERVCQQIPAGLASAGARGRRPRIARRDLQPHDPPLASRRGCRSDRPTPPPRPDGAWSDRTSRSASRAGSPRTASRAAAAPGSAAPARRSRAEA